MILVSKINKYIKPILHLIIDNSKALPKDQLAFQFNKMMEEELRKIYQFFVNKERDLYQKINMRLHIRKKYEYLTLKELSKELDELQSVSNIAMLLSKYVFINLTGIEKILKKFDKKFKRYNLDFGNRFITEKYLKKNSDLLYIHQYKILDEVGACVEQLKNELKEIYEYFVDNPIVESNNERISKFKEQNKSDKLIINNNDDLLLNNQEEEIKKDENNNILTVNDEIKKKFNTLQISIESMEAFYHSTSEIFSKWIRIIKKNDYKSGIYSVKSAGEINYIDNNKDIKSNKIHYLSRSNYWNIRLILIQALIMTICSTYVFPTIYYLLKRNINGIRNGTIKETYLSGFIISMSPIGGLISMIISYYIVKKSYKIGMILSSALSTIGNSLFIIGISRGHLYLVCIGRLITGFSSNTPIHRQYLLYFIPKRRLEKYLLYFKLICLMGISFGPLLSLLFLVILGDKVNKKFTYSHFNAFTLPGFVCLFLSIFLFIVIIALFSEPLSPKFMIYGKGQSPTEIMANNDSFSLDDNLTIYESEKLNEINQKVSIVNDESQFHDSNLVSITIRELIGMEMDPYGTVKKTFLFIIIYLFVLNFTLFSYITMGPIFYIYTIGGDIPGDSGNKYSDETDISLLYFISWLLVVPAFCLNYFYISLRVNKILYIKILSLILFFLETLTTIFTMQMNKYFFYFSFLFTILCVNILQDQLIYFYTQIIPTNFRFMRMNGITALHVVQYMGNIIGSISSLIGFLTPIPETDDFDTIDSEGQIVIIIQNSFSVVLQLILLLVLFLYSNKFSDRPIRRIIFSKNSREIKRTEF